ncbi:glycosyl hydrolase [Aspergillus karnatakaensis]|uniref:beta-xylosidase n=1 Tax=Aspergillus karnatakaensis TaxID=1810916 RepID=UPI003CCE4D4E
MKLPLILRALLPLLYLAQGNQAAHISIQNPILPGFNPDPAILRVGTDYYLAVSSFEYHPGIPIYHSTDLQTWTLHSHALTTPTQLPLHGIPTAAGAWAPSLSLINGTYHLTLTIRWTYDPIAKLWPRVFWVTSPDLKTWSEPIWADPWGIDPDLFTDPATNKTYLTLMAPNNNIDRLWGISQCEVDLHTGSCLSPYRSIWNGTLPQTPSSRPEGPKLLKRGKYYYLLIAEGGTDELHRATIARSTSPTGPWESNPDNPLLYNGAYGFTNLTVQSTGHATMFDTPEGDWCAVFLARRNIDGFSPLGRETFLCAVEWVGGWPVFNRGGPILLNSEENPKAVPGDFVDEFEGEALGSSWYLLRTPYAEGRASGLILRPNVFSLSDRDTPAAVFRKQTSLNMTFAATLLPFEGGSLGPRQTVGVSAYLSELQHQDIGITGCRTETGNRGGLCVYVEMLNNGTREYTEHPLRTRSNGKQENGLTLYIRAAPHEYKMGYSYSSSKGYSDSHVEVTWLTSFPSSYLATAPPDWFVFSGAMFGLFASGNGEPWPVSGPRVGFERVREVYFEERIADYGLSA